MRVERLDHLVLTVTDPAATVSFYTQVCGMSHTVEQDIDGERHSLSFGNQRINLQVWGSVIEPRAAMTAPGSADLCFVVDGTTEEVVAHLNALGTHIEQGPSDQIGANGPMTSVYVRDPDKNLVNLACYAAPVAHQSVKPAGHEGGRREPGSRNRQAKAGAGRR